MVLGLVIVVISFKIITKDSFVIVCLLLDFVVVIEVIEVIKVTEVIEVSSNSSNCLIIKQLIRLIIIRVSKLIGITFFVSTINLRFIHF